MLRRAAVYLVLPLLLLTSANARADERLSLERQGDDAFAEERWDDAAGFYDAAYALHEKDPQAPPTKLLSRLVTVFERLERYPEALDRLAALAASGGASRDPALEGRLEALRKRVAVVVIETSVCDAAIKIRGKASGLTCAPKTLKVNAGPARIEVSKEGHYPFARTVDLEGGTTTAVVVPLDRVPRSILAVTSPVAGARVIVDGRDIGTAPTETVVQPGTHAVVVSQEGYETRQVSTLVGVGQRTDVDLHLVEKKTFTSTWWFWTAVGVGAATAATATVFLLTGGSSDPDAGTISPGRVSAPLRF